MTEQPPFPEVESGIAKIPELTKTNIINAAASKSKEILDEGNVSILEAYIKAKAMLEYSKQLVLDLNEPATDEATKYGKEGQKTILGVEFGVANSGKKFDFSGDTEWNDLNEGMGQLKEEMKKRETFLKTLKKEMAETDGGEVIKPPKILSEGKDTLKITFKR